MRGLLVRSFAPPRPDHADLEIVAVDQSELAKMLPVLHHDVGDGTAVGVVIYAHLRFRAADFDGRMRPPPLDVLHMLNHSGTACAAVSHRRCEA